MNASSLRVEQEAELPAALGELGLAPAPGAIVLVGGAGGMDLDEVRRVEPLFCDAVVPVADRVGAVVVDGGTDTGVMRLVGRARAAAGASFPLLGVVAAALVGAGDGANQEEGFARYEPHHTHFLFVPGRMWGDESPWLARVASVLAGEASVTLLVNGGEIAWLDAARSVEVGRRVIAVAGSGRTADALAAAARTEPSDPRARDLIASGLVDIVSWDDAYALKARLTAVLAERV